jgi:hypothetical protein
MNSYFAEFQAHDRIDSWHREAEESRRLVGSGNLARRRLLMAALARRLAGLARLDWAKAVDYADTRVEESTEIARPIWEAPEVIRGAASDSGTYARP